MMKRYNSTALLLAAVLTPSAATQDKLGPRSFHPTNYSSEAFVDFKAMRDAELWDGIERAAFARMLLGEFERMYGFALEDVDTMRGSFVFPNKRRSNPQQVFIFEGNENVVLDSQGVEPGGRSVEEVKIGDHAAVRTSYGYEGAKAHLYTSPKKGVLVYGDEELIAPVLRGERQGGVPTPDLMSLTTRPGALAYMAFTLNDAMRADMPPFMSEGWLTEGDPLSHMIVRICTSGTADDTTILLEAVIRCEKGEQGPAVIKKQVEAGLEYLKKDRQLGALKRFWEKVEVVREGRDVTLTLDLGSPREAAGALPQLIAPMFMTRKAEVAAPAIIKEAPAPAAVEAEPASRPAKKKKK